MAYSDVVSNSGEKLEEFLPQQLFLPLYFSQGFSL